MKKSIFELFIHAFIFKPEASWKCHDVKYYVNMLSKNIAHSMMI